MDFKTLRRKSGFTQQQLADELGIHFTNVSKWDQGASLPEKHIPKIAELFGVSEQRLIASFSSRESERPDAIYQWIERVIRADMEPNTRLILIALPGIADEETNVAVVDFDNLAERIHVDDEMLTDAWNSVLNSGFVETLGGTRNVLKLVY